MYPHSYTSLKVVHNQYVREAMDDAIVYEAQANNNEKSREHAPENKANFFSLLSFFSSKAREAKTQSC